jgi:maltose O-acetyltransferase
MFNKLVYLFKFLLKVKFNKNINSNTIVILQKNVKLIIEEGGEIVFGKNVVIKENTTLYAKKNAKITFGDNTSTGHHTEISANISVEIGSEVIMGAYTYITDSNHDYRNSNLPIRKQGMLAESTVVGNNVWIGRNTMLLKGSKIGKNSVVAGGSVVTKKYNGNIILAGIPAKIIKRIYE